MTTSNTVSQDAQSTNSDHTDAASSRLDRLVAFFTSFSTEERATVFSDPSFTALAFVSGATVQYLTHIKLEDEGDTITAICGDFPHGEFSVVSVSVESLFIDCFRWMACRSVRQVGNFIHWGPRMTPEVIASTFLGDQATKREIKAFIRKERDEFYPPLFPNDDAVIVGVPRVFPLFRGDSYISQGYPVPSDNLWEAWLNIQLVSIPVTRDFALLPGYTTAATWETPTADLPGTINFPLTIEYYEEDSNVWENVVQRSRVQSTPPRSRKRPLTLRLGSPPSRRLTRPDPPQIPVQPPQTTCPTAVNPSQSQFSNVPATTTAANKIALLDVHTHLTLFYCVLEVDQGSITSVQPPTFNAHFQQGISTEKDKKSLFRYLKRNYFALQEELATSKHYLTDMVDYNSFEPLPPLFNLFAEAIITTKPFQQYRDIKELSAVVSLASFAVPKKSDHGYAQYIAHAETNRLDDANDQTKEKVEKIQTKLFEHTNFDRSYDDVMHAVAHFLAFSQSIIDMSWDEDDVTNPTIVRMFLKLAHLAKNATLRDLFTKSATDSYHPMPWIWHSLFLAFQSLFQQAALLLLSPKATMSVMHKSITEIPLNIFTPMLTAFNFACSELELMTRIISVSADSYKGCPPSYRILGSGKPPTTRYEKPGLRGDTALAGDTTTNNITNTKGWLRLLDTTKSIFSFRPQIAQPGICLRHAFEGEQCKNRSCTYRHVPGLASLNEIDKAIVTSYIEAHPQMFQLATSVKKPYTGVSTNKKTVALKE